MKTLLITLAFAAMVACIIAVLVLGIMLICSSPMGLLAKVIASMVFSALYIGFWLFITEVWL